MLHTFFKLIRKHGIALLFFPVLVFLGCSIYYYHINQSFVSFTKSLFNDEITSNTLNLHYTLNDPAAFGIKDYPITFGNADPEAITASWQSLDAWQEILLDYPRFWLSNSNRLTYDIMNLCFKTQKEGARYPLYGEPLGPSLGTQAQLPVLLAEYSFSDKQDVEEYLSLLTRLPAYFEDLLAYEMAKSEAGLFMNDTMAQGIIDQCNTFTSEKTNNLLFSTFENRLDKLSFLTEEEKQTYRQENQAAIETFVFPAYKKLAEGIASLKGTGTNDRGLCYYPQGKSYYSWLIKDSSGCYDNMDTILARIQMQLDSDIQELRTLVEENPSLLSENGFQELTKHTASLNENPETILADLQEKIIEDFPALPAVSYDVKYVEKSLEKYSSPAFYLTAPLDNPNQNVIYINSGANYQGLDLYSTLAHEGYPGHLYQTVFSQQSGTNPVRSLLNFSGYVEGWATYIEMMSFSYADVSEETAALYRINRSLSLGISSILDILIHYYGYNREQAAAFLEPFGYTGETVVNTFYDTILETPANYLKYYLGCLCFQDLQKAARSQEREDFSLQNFHKKILETGPCPFPVLYDYVLE